MSQSAEELATDEGRRREREGEIGNGAEDVIVTVLKLNREMAWCASAPKHG